MKVGLRREDTLCCSKWSVSVNKITAGLLRWPPPLIWDTTRLKYSYLSLSIHTVFLAKVFSLPIGCWHPMEHTCMADHFYPHHSWSAQRVFPLFMLMSVFMYTRCCYDHHRLALM